MRNHCDPQAVTPSNLGQVIKGTYGRALHLERVAGAGYVGDA